MITDFNKVIVPIKEKQEEEKQKFSLVGYRIFLNNGSNAFYCTRTNTISVTTKPTKQYYRSGSVVVDTKGNPIFTKPKKIKGIPLAKLNKYYGNKFVEEIEKFIKDNLC